MANHDNQCCEMKELDVEAVELWEDSHSRFEQRVHEKSVEYNPESKFFKVTQEIRGCFVIVNRSLTIECVNNLIALVLFSIINALKLCHTIITINCSVFCTLLNVIVKVKVSPLQAMKAHGGCGCKGPHIHRHGTRKR